MQDLPDFETLMRMAKEDPQALEQLRTNLCNDLIDKAPSTYQSRLRGLQFRVDMERRLAKTPMAACIRISQMMHDSLLDLGEALNGDSVTKNSAKPQSTHDSEKKQSATIISFTQPEDETSVKLKK